MAQEYVEAPAAVSLGDLSNQAGSAPPVAKDVN